MRFLAAAVLLAGSTYAQFRVFVGTAAVGGQYAVGAAAVGDILDSRFRVMNTGPAPAPLRELSVAGAGFRLIAGPVLPLSLPAGGSADFVVRFQPYSTGTFSASLRVEDEAVTLRGTGLAALTVLSEGAPVAGLDFGRVERGTRAVRRLVLENRTAERLVLPRITVFGEAFRTLGAPQPGPWVEPREALAFEVAYEPRAAGAHEGVLEIEPRRLALAGSAVEPPLPRPELELDLAAPESARQGKVSLRLATPSRTAGTGELRIDFSPAVPGPDDPMLQFASGGRSATFTVAEGDEAARFAGGASLGFQTGTTAGTVTFTARLGEFTAQRAVIIPEKPVWLSWVTANWGNATVGVEFAGWDNTRSASQLAFTFLNRSGETLPPGRIAADAAAAFRRYFETSEVGGVFLVRATFPVTGPVQDVQMVVVEATNAQGTAKTERVMFRP